MGFGEIQFDYIRFPEPYPSLPKQVFPGSNGVSKPDVLASFLKEANSRYDKLGVRTTADIFGLVTTVNGALEVGQWWEKISPTVDVVLPMVYPSHFAPGTYKLASPNAAPYATIDHALDDVARRSRGVPNAARVVPWYQDFTLGPPRYGAEHVREQMRAGYDYGVKSWMLWNPGSRYSTQALAAAIAPADTLPPGYGGSVPAR